MSASADPFAAVVGVSRGSKPRLAHPEGGWAELARLAGEVRAGRYGGALEALLACHEHGVEFSAGPPCIGLGSPADRLLFVVLSSLCDAHLAAWAESPDNPLQWLADPAGGRSRIRDRVFELDGGFIFDADPLAGARGDVASRMSHTLRDALTEDARADDRWATVLRWAGPSAGLQQRLANGLSRDRVLAQLNLDSVARIGVLALPSSRACEFADVSEWRRRLLGELCRQIDAIEARDA